jgi:hypothetical protein
VDFLYSSRMMFTLITGPVSSQISERASVDVP